MLVTDLVGSTAMADRVGPAATEDLRTEHFGLLRGALERTGGRELKNLVLRERYTWLAVRS
jgi:class 3 adenylate cyclase